MTPIEEHTALVAAVTEMLRVAEAAEPEWVHVGIATTGLPPAVAPDGIVDYLATHHPVLMIAVHREALERLNRHRPIPPEATQTHLRSACAACLPSVRPWVYCPEVAGLRSVYMKGEQT